MSLPLVTPELVLRIERVWRTFWTAHLTGVSNQPGNPLHATVEWFGQAVALRAPGAADDPWLNRVLCLTDADADSLPVMIRGYRELGVTVHVEVLPGLAGPDLLDRLAGLGCHQVGFHSVTYGLPLASLDRLPPDVTVTEVGRDHRETFLRTLLLGFGAPADAPVDSLRHWCEIPGAKLYLAYVGSEPAGAAVLYLQDGIGYMANASTRPELRGRGCQKALLQRRIADARELGCDLVTAMAEFNSVSQHNMERMGLRMAYTKADWAG